MLIFYRKRILFIIFAVIIAVCIPIIQEKKYESIETVALPVSNKIIVIDAGHGLPDERGCLLTLINNN